MKRLSPYLALLVGMCVSVPAAAQEKKEEKKDQNEERAARPRLGLAPGAPQVRSAPPNLPFGIKSRGPGEYTLDFHGYLLLPLTFGVAKRANPADGQNTTVLHNPPDVPGGLRNFEWTGVVPSPWIQLDFTYGTTLVNGTLIIAAKNANAGSAYTNAVEQIGISDAFLTLDLTEPLGAALMLNVGAFSSRYGNMGEYDLGRYGTPLIGRVNAVGEVASIAVDVDDFSFVLEHGIGGQIGRTDPTDFVPAGWNDFAPAGVGSTLVNHAHLGIGYGGLVQLGGHYMTGWTQDDRVTPNASQRDGRITVLGGDLRLTLGRFGHLYGGVGLTDAVDSRTVGGAIEVLNARGGYELMTEYLGPGSGGTGKLTSIGAQYDFSLGRLMYPELKGDGPDFVLSIFGMNVGVTSKDKSKNVDGVANYDGVTKRKYGAEATYAMLPWLAAGVRYDAVIPNVDAPATAHEIISPRVIFHTDWNSQDQVVLQYSRFMYGNQVVVDGGYPPTPQPSIYPDENVITLSGSMWW